MNPKPTTKTYLRDLTRRVYLASFLSIPALALAASVATVRPQASASVLTPVEQENAAETATEPLDGSLCDRYDLDCRSADLQEASLIASDKWDVPYELLLGIANAESSLGTNWFGCKFSYNAWGVKGQPAETCNGHIKSYGSWVDAADDVARILRHYYLDEGRITPEQIVRKYVGWQNDDWVRNVRNYYQP